MIKKILGFLTFILLSISFSSALDYGNGITLNGGQGYGFPLGTYGVYYDGSSGASIQDFDGNIYGDFNFDGNVFRFNPVPLQGTTSYEDTYFWRTLVGLKYQFNSYRSTNIANGIIVGFFSCSEFPSLGNTYLKNNNSCVYHTGFDSLEAYLQNPTSWGYNTRITTSSRNIAICVEANNNYICMDSSYPIETSTTLKTYDYVRSEAILNPFVSSNNQVPDYTFTGGNTIDIRSDIDDYIQFYEDNFNWDINMCYVGTYDTGSVYGTPGIDFIYGSGNTIYGLYYGIYNSFGNNKIHNVGAFVNTYLLNYATWFETPVQERLYQATYNGPDQNVTYIYTGFTFPFADKPVAIYFMSDLLSERYITESSQGENIVFYCDMKLNYENYKNGSLSFTGIEDLVDPKIINRIEDWKDWGLPGTGGYSVPDNTGFWSTQIVSGYNIPNDLNPTSLFQDTFSKLTNLVKNFSPTGSGILPWWILYPMIFLILFRMLRH